MSRKRKVNVSKMVIKTQARSDGDLVPREEIDADGCPDDFLHV